MTIRGSRPLTDYAAYTRGLWALTVAQLGIGLDRVPTSAAVLGVSMSAPDRPGPPPSDPDLSRATRVAHRLASALGPRNYCLRHSLVLGHLLRSHGPTLRFGVRRDLNGFEAHAWIEIGGNRVARTSTRDEADFIPLGRFT